VTWTIHLGDCLEYLRTLPSGSVDAVVTDPPYSSGGMVRGDRMMSTRDKYQSSDVVTEFAAFTGDNRDQRGFSYWCALWLSEARRIAKPGAMLCIFTDWRQLPTTTDAIQAGGWVWRGIVPWDKVVARPMPGRFRAQAEYMVWGTNGPRDFSTEGEPAYGVGVFRHSTTPTAEREHSTQKPEELLKDIVAVACPRDTTVLDPFAGSGTTGVAAIRMGRNFIGCEISPEYHAIATRRLKEAEAADGLFAQSTGYPQTQPAK